MSKKIIPVERIAQCILYLRGQKKIILDRDLAVLYGVETRILNQAVKRNAGRFPDDFMFKLTREEITLAWLSSTTCPSSSAAGTHCRRLLSRRLRSRRSAATTSGGRSC